MKSYQEGVWGVVGGEDESSRRSSDPKSGLEDVLLEVLVGMVSAPAPLESSRDRPAEDKDFNPRRKDESSLGQWRRRLTKRDPRE